MCSICLCVAVATIVDVVVGVDFLELTLIFALRGFNLKGECRGFSPEAFTPTFHRGPRVYIVLICRAESYLDYERPDTGLVMNILYHVSVLSATLATIFFTTTLAKCRYYTLIKPYSKAWE